MPRSRRFRSFSPNFRLFFLALVMLSGLGVLVGRLWWEQVAHGEIWSKKLANRSVVKVRIPSVRGEIRDRNGVTLVGNRASYEVDFYLRQMVSGYRRAHPKEKMPMLTYTTKIREMRANKKVPDVVKIVNDEVIPKLQPLNLAKDYNAERLQKHYRNDTEVPFPYLEEIDFPTIAKFSEHNVGLPGVEISLRPVRQYIYGAFAAHLLGYVGAPLSIDAQPDVKDYNYYQPDVEGKSQIELRMDKFLRGKPGTRVLQRSIKGAIESEEISVKPTPGANVYLTLDARIQMIVEQALRHPALGRAAAVVLDANSGDILGMASIPSFDPNIFIPSISTKDWNAMRDDIAVPLVSRAVSGFPPGSIFKIVTALAGLDESHSHKKNLDVSRYNCPGGLQYGDHFFHCWISEKGGQHGVIGLEEALKVSCDCYFYQYGNDASIESIDHMGHVLGLGEKFDLGLGDQNEGCLPGPDWLRRRYPQEKWTSAYTANVTIGQGYVLTSPLQMATAYVALANGGKVYEPRLIKSVLDQDGKPVLDEEGKVAWPDESKIREDLTKVVSKADIDQVRKGLWKVVNEAGGTGGKARMKNIVVAGKTGTAQATDLGKKEYIAWFCCFAPYDNPRYVICTMVQGGVHGGGVAAPIADHILEQCFAMDQGTYQVELTKLAPARSDHPFQPIEALPPYKNSADIVVNAEEETAGDKEPSSEIQMKRQKKEDPHPDIRPDADDGGRVSKKATNSKSKPSTTPAPDARNAFQRFFNIKKPSVPPTGKSPNRSH